MIAHTLLCYSLYSRECWEHEWPLGSAGMDLVRCGDLGALLGLRREYSAALGRKSRANHQGAARTQRHSAPLPTARACTRWYMEPKPLLPHAPRHPDPGTGPRRRWKSEAFVGTM